MSCFFAKTIKDKKRFETTNIITIFNDEEFYFCDKFCTFINQLKFVKNRLLCHLEF